MMVSFSRLPADSQSAVIIRLTGDDARHIPGAPLRVSGRHVLLAENGVITEGDVRVRMSSLRILALGDVDEGVLVFGERESSGALSQSNHEQMVGEKELKVNSNSSSRSGDDEFLMIATSVSPDLARISSALIARIREKYLGELAATAGNGKKFVETPDNFWAVEVQNRKCALKIIIRSTESLLKKSGIEYKSERPPSYFYVKVENDNDIKKALDFISLADKR